MKIFMDSADLSDMRAARNVGIDGFTTNPTLARKAGVTDYLAWARDVVQAVPDRPVSLEVFADDAPEMERQAKILAALGPNVYVKIPITNTRGESSAGVVWRLTGWGVKVNVTAVFTEAQLRMLHGALADDVPAIVSVFAGRIADTGRDPARVVATAVARFADLPNVQVLWASTREALNIEQARAAGAHIITVPPDLLQRVADLDGKDLDAFSLETVQMFARDAAAAGFVL